MATTLHVLKLFSARLVLLIAALATIAGAGPSLVATGRAATPGLVAAYSFDAGSGMTAVDASGSANTGTLAGGTAWTAAGKYGAAVSFDGVDDYVTVADAPELDLTTGMTLEAWIKPDVNTGWRTVLTKETTGNLVYGLFSSSDTGAPAGIVTLGGGDLQSIARGGSTPAGSWTHLATTYDGSTIRLYANGTSIATLAAPGSMVATTGALVLGGNSVWSEWFDGTIDDVRVYNRALSASEIATDMTTPVGTTTAAPANTALPTISGRLVQGEKLTAANGTWTGSPTSYAYQWQACDAAGAACVARSATAKTYTLAQSDIGRTMRVRVTATNAGGSTAATSAQTGLVVDDLVAAYAFDAGSGMSAADESGTGNTGTLSGPTWTTAGRFGGALAFDGIADWVTVNDSASLDLTNRMTLEAWVLPSANDSWRTVVTKETAGNLVYGLMSGSDTNVPAGLVTVGATDLQTLVRGTAPVPAGGWTHLAASYDGANVRLFVNGVLAATLAQAGDMLASSAPLRIGGNSVWSEWFHGTIDEVRVYRRALTAAQISADMNASVGGAAPPPPPPPPGDTQAPTAPTGLAKTGSTTTSVSLSWNAATDNVGVTGYGAYVNGTLDGTSTGTAYTASGLACGTAYTFAADAVDAAGNRSAKTALSASTSPCPPPPPPTGAATVFVSPTGNDAGSCTQAAPCGTFDRAYRVAQPGDTVEVGAGSYPYQQLNADSTKTSTADVVFRPAAGATVFVRTIALGDGLGTPAASHLTFRDFVTGEMQAFTPAKDVTWQNIDSGNFYIRGIQDFHIVGGDWGPCSSRSPDCGGNSKIDYPAGEQPNDNITIDGAKFHDYFIDNPADHYECLFVSGGTNIQIRNSKFTRCDFYDIFFTRINTTSAGTFAGLRVENNWFDQPWDGQGGKNRAMVIAFKPNGAPSPAFTDVLIRFNSMASGISVNDDGDGNVYSNFRIVGNIADGPDLCYGFVTYVQNLWTRGTCGATDRSLGGGAFPYANLGGFDFHLTGGTAVDLVTSTSADAQLGTDLDAETRPKGAARDAGADELR